MSADFFLKKHVSISHPGNTVAGVHLHPRRPRQNRCCVTFFFQILWALMVLLIIHRVYPSLVRVVESTMSYTFTRVWSFTSPGIDARSNGPPAFSLFRKTLEKWCKRNCQSLEAATVGFKPRVSESRTPKFGSGDSGIQTQGLWIEDSKVWKRRQWDSNPGSLNRGLQSLEAATVGFKPRVSESRTPKFGSGDSGIQTQGLWIEDSKVWKRRQWDSNPGSLNRGLQSLEAATVGLKPRVSEPRTPKFGSGDSGIQTQGLWIRDSKVWKRRQWDSNPGPLNRGLPKFGSGDSGIQTQGLWIEDSKQSSTLTVNFAKNVILPWNKRWFCGSRLHQWRATTN